MSRTRPELRSPVRKFVEYKGGDGRFEYYDKEQKKRIRLELPLKFIALDWKRSTVTGYNEKLGVGIYANEVAKLSQTLRVRYFKGDILAEGPWEKIKGTVDSKGGKFCKVIYGALKVEPTEENPDGFEYVAFKLDGAALGPWFDFQNETNLLHYGVEILDEFVDKSKGSVKYKEPVFRAVKLSEKHGEIADRMDTVLQEYFDRYDAQGLSGDETAADTKEVSDPGSDLPPVEFSGTRGESFDGFDDSKGAKSDEPASNVSETPDGFRNKNVDPDDLPF